MDPVATLQDDKRQDDEKREVYSFFQEFLELPLAMCNFD